MQVSGLGLWKENNVGHFGKWNVCTCEHLVFPNALLAFMLRKTTFKYIRKSFRGVYIDGLWIGNTFSFYCCPVVYHSGLYSPSECMYYVPTFVASKCPMDWFMLLTHLHR
jgi:hypothetical protein